MYKVTLTANKSHTVFSETGKRGTSTVLRIRVLAAEAVLEKITERSNVAAAGVTFRSTVR